MNLQEVLSNIMNAAYGEDVRQAILNGLGLCYSERASGGYDPVEDLNDFQNGIILCSSVILNHPFNSVALVISGGMELSRCQVAFELTDPVAGVIRTKNSSGWTEWESIVNDVMHFIKYWSQDGRELLYTERVSEGHNGHWNGVSEKASTPQYDYIFTGWSRSPNQTVNDENAVVNITADRDVFAAFNPQIRSYTVRFNNDETVMDTQTIVYGSNASDAGLSPTKASTPQYSYTFIGWNTDSSATEADENALKNITGNRELYAIYRSTVRSYRVTFMNGSTELQTVIVPYGGNATYSGATVPTKPSTPQYDYSFVGWSLTDDATVGDDNATRNITADRIVYAAFSSEVLVYTVRFMNGATVLETVSVQYGENVTYSGSDPTKESTVQYDYTFADGWNTDPNATEVDPDATKNISGDRDLYAVFTATLRQYEVTFYNGATKLGSTDVDYGGTAVYSGTTPTKASSAQYNYSFAGWARSDGQTEADTTALTNITGPRDVYTVFTATVRNYTVRFLNNGSVLETKSVPYGGNAAYTGNDPTKERTAQYTYSWVGWNSSPNQTVHDETVLQNITSNRDIYAAFSQTINSYIVSFYYNGMLLDTDTVNYGENATYSGDPPTKPMTEEHRYVFDGWNSLENQTEAEPDILNNITGTLTVYAAFRELSIECTVRFYNGSTLLYTDTVNYGQNASYVGDNPTKTADVYYTYSFVGWNSSVDQTTADADILNNIRDDKDVYAAYSRTAVQYTVTFIYDGVTLDTQQTTYGGSVTYHGQQPTKTGDAQYSYTFAGWNTDSSAETPDVNALSDITASKTVYPIFTRSVNEYTVHFMNGETVLQTLSVPYGSDAVYSGTTPVHPDGDEYLFIGWNSQKDQTAAESGVLENITANKTVYAAFSAKSKYTIGNRTAGTQIYVNEYPEYDDEGYGTGTPTAAQYIYLGKDGDGNCLLLRRWIENWTCKFDGGTSNDYIDYGASDASNGIKTTCSGWLAKYDRVTQNALAKTTIYYLVYKNGSLGRKNEKSKCFPLSVCNLGYTSGDPAINDGTSYLDALKKFYATTDDNTARIGYIENTTTKVNYWTRSASSNKKVMAISPFGYITTVEQTSGIYMRPTIAVNPNTPVTFSNGNTYLAPVE